MKKIAIYVCGEVSERCTGNGCLKSFNNGVESFSSYDKNAELVCFNSCNGCAKDPIGSLDLKMEKFLKAKVDVVHLSTCIRGRCEYYEEMAKKLSSQFNVVGYTHGSKQGKKNNCINLKKHE